MTLLAGSKGSLWIHAQSVTLNQVIGRQILLRFDRNPIIEVNQVFLNLSVLLLLLASKLLLFQTVSTTLKDHDTWRSRLLTGLLLRMELPS